MGVLETLDKLSSNLNDSSKLATIGSMAADIIRGHIHKGEGFKPLSPATASYRGAGRPLQDTGGLRDSISFKVIDERTVSVGTNKPYAALQNNGGVIQAKKEWLWIPAVGTRQLQRKYGYSPTDVIKGLKSSGLSVFRMGRTMCYKRKGKDKTVRVIYYLKKSVEIPARPFFYLNDKEMNQLMREVGSAIEQL